ncbi:hypothetical protein CALCODRAFT_508475 [Calocera cornea HHB12733]|uniref:Zinc finger PHD-type domain-containing protein n=1 Tax=Calocera cornea HHB12733 TaxID=1353952 RepID=A0A165GCQ8_9BASI|nr:hypothetical protein CALCODRAFT_508475 [Calocera cornea HHB12733]
MPTLRARPPPPPPAPSTSRPPPPPPVLFDPVPAPSEAVRGLRTNWRFAAVCQFIFTFEEALQLGEFETEEFEDDLTLGSHKIINKMMWKLLSILTYDRRITEENWERFLRTQYERRLPDAPLLGTEDEPVEWSELRPEQRIEAVHMVTEWMFVNPNGIRRKMKDEESAFLWRVEPIGYDAKKGAYWLFDDNRLWVQRLPPKPKVSHKKKEKPAAPKAAQPPQKKQKLSAQASKPKTPAKTATPAPKKQEEETRSNGRYPRRAATAKPPPPSPARSPPKPRVLGIRQSTRLRGKTDEWQEIPEEWLAEDGAPGAEGETQVNGNGSGRKRALEDDDDSELTELSDEEGGAEKEKDEDVEMKDAEELVKQDQADTTAPSSSLSSPPATPPPPSNPVNPVEAPTDFIEWETIAVTLFQWTHIAERFEKSTNKDERAFHTLLVEDVVPRVLAELKEIERLRRKEELLATRKRSSRLQMKEIEAEAKKLEEQRRADDDMLNARNNRAAEREKRAEAERIERERKIKEREERALKREMWQPTLSATPGADDKQEGEDSSTAVDEADKGDKGRRKSSPARKMPKEEERWELDCEVCGKKGWNVDDGKKMACCEVCGKWQQYVLVRRCVCHCAHAHASTACHDAEDIKAGKQKRRWSQVTFKCKECRNKHRRELYAKRQEAAKIKADEERAAQIAAGIVPTTPVTQPQANDQLKIHLTLPKMPTLIGPGPKPQPAANGVATPTGAAGRPPIPIPAMAHRVHTSPKVPNSNGYSAPFGSSSSPSYPAAQHGPREPAPFDRRTSGSHSPTVPAQPPYYNPAAATYSQPPHAANYPPQYRAYSPSMGYPASNTGAQSPHTAHPPLLPPAAHPSPSTASAAHHSPAPAQQSPNPQQAYQYSYPPGYGAPGYAYGFNHAPAPPGYPSREQQEQYYQYYPTYGSATESRYAYPASYQPVAPAKPYAAPPQGVNGSSPSTGAPPQGTPISNGHTSRPSSAEKPVMPSTTSLLIQPHHSDPIPGTTAPSTAALQSPPQPPAPSQPPPAPTVAPAHAQAGQ